MTLLAIAMRLNSFYQSLLANGERTVSATSPLKDKDKGKGKGKTKQKSNQIGKGEARGKTIRLNRLAFVCWKGGAYEKSGLLKLRNQTSTPQLGIIGNETKLF